MWPELFFILAAAQVAFGVETGAWLSWGMAALCFGFGIRSSIEDK